MKLTMTQRNFKTDDDRVLCFQVAPDGLWRIVEGNSVLEQGRNGKPSMTFAEHIVTSFLAREQQPV